MFECGYCELEFKSQEDAEYHMDQNDHWWDCDWCEKTFRTETAANAHKVAKNHLDSEFECLRCEREFNSQNALDQHMNALDHWPPASKHKCETCDEMFVEKRTAREHMDYWEHWKGPRFECQTCDRTFSSEQGADQHMDDLDHWMPTVKCETCDRMFFTEESAEQHMRAKGHHKPLPHKNQPAGQVEQPQANNGTKSEAQPEGLKQTEIMIRAKENIQSSTMMSEQASKMLQKATAMMEKATAIMEEIKNQTARSADYKEKKNTLYLPDDDKDSRQGTVCENTSQPDQESMMFPLDGEIGIPCPFCDKELRHESALTYHIDIGACPMAADCVREAVRRIIHGLVPDDVLPAHEVKSLDIDMSKESYIIRAQKSAPRNLEIEQ